MSSVFKKTNKKKTNNCQVKSSIEGLQLEKNINKIQYRYCGIRQERFILMYQ